MNTLMFTVEASSLPSVVDLISQYGLENQMFGQDEDEDYMMSITFEDEEQEDELLDDFLELADLVEPEDV